MRVYVGLSEYQLNICN